MSEPSTRVHLAWLIYCVTEGYLNPKDREGMDNWLVTVPDNALSDEEASLKQGLLIMADEVLNSSGVRRVR